MRLVAVVIGNGNVHIGGWGVLNREIVSFGSWVRKRGLVADSGLGSKIVFSGSWTFPIIPQILKIKSFGISGK